eukprot:scaffold1290_cov112-Skeletonema_dohrnii-CCMP3373.AAC.15
MKSARFMTSTAMMQHCIMCCPQLTDVLKSEADNFSICAPTKTNCKRNPSCVLEVGKGDSVGWSQFIRAQMVVACLID